MDDWTDTELEVAIKMLSISYGVLTKKMRELPPGKLYNETRFEFENVSAVLKRLRDEHSRRVGRAS